MLQWKAGLLSLSLTHMVLNNMLQRARDKEIKVTGRLNSCNLLADEVKRSLSSLQATACVHIGNLIPCDKLETSDRASLSASVYVCVLSVLMWRHQKTSLLQVRSLSNAAHVFSVN